MLKIGLDVDGVFAHFNPAFAATLATVTGKSLVDPAVEPTVWNWMKAAGYTQSEVAAAWAAVDADPLWWTTLAAYPQTIEVLGHLCEHIRRRRATVHFLTTRNSPTAHWQTTKWLQTWMSPTVAPQVCICSNAESKGLIAKALGLHVFLDDNVDNLLAVRRHSDTTVCLLYDQPWNRATEVRGVLGGLGVRVLTSLPQLLHYIEYLMTETATVTQEIKTA